MARNQGTGTSMLQEIMDKMRSENKKQVIHCLVAVSRLSSAIADKRDVGLHYEKLFKACQAKYQGEGPTGVLLVYPQHCVHLMEAPWEIVVEIVADLKTMDTSGGLLLESRILVFSPNISLRLYPQWAQRLLNLPALPRGEVYKTNDPIEVTVGNSLDCLYKLGVQLSKLSPHQLKSTMDNLTSKLPHLLLQQDVMEYYLSCSALNTPAKFLERYASLTRVVLDSELVWPLPVRLFPYDD